MIQIEDDCVHIQYDKSSLNTFKHSLSEISTIVQANILSVLPKNFALIFGWQIMPEAHYVAVFDTISEEGGSACPTLLPLKDETNQSAGEHIIFLKCVPSVSGKSPLNFVAIISDNCNVRRSMSTKIRILLLCCASRQFQLAVQEIDYLEEDIILQVNQLMVKLRTRIMSAKLQRHTPLHPKLRNDTIWSSTFEMFWRQKHFGHTLLE